MESITPEIAIYSIDAQGSLSAQNITSIAKNRLDVSFTADNSTTVQGAIAIFSPKQEANIQPILLTLSSAVITVAASIAIAYFKRIRN